MPLIQLLPPSTALQLSTIIRNPQGATKLGEGREGSPHQSNRPEGGRGRVERMKECKSSAEGGEREM